MLPRHAYRGQIVLNLRDIPPGLYRIKAGWTALRGDADDGSLDLVGPTIDDRLSPHQAVDLRVLGFEQPWSGLANASDVGRIGVIGDIMVWDHEGLVVHPTDAAA